MNIRARFEEIWPVPEGIMWTDDCGYLPVDSDDDHLIDVCLAMDARLDTFTRCQETTDVYASLINELVDELECMTASFYTPSSDEVIYRAKKIIGAKE